MKVKMRKGQAEVTIPDYSIEVMKKRGFEVVKPKADKPKTKAPDSGDSPK